MQVEIKTSAVTQLRQTFSHTAKHIGSDKPASRYQEATFGMQPEVNFHYRPLWAPELEIYDVHRTKIVMKNWYALKDPRQYYYGAYTIARARQQEAMDKNIDFVERHGLLKSLSEDVRQQLAFVMVPLRHMEWAANTNNCYVTAYAWGTALTQATMFHAMDRLGIAQYLSRLGLLLDGNTGDLLDAGKSAWMEHPAWQGLRRFIEKTMVKRDCFEIFVVQNLVVDGYLYPLIFRDFVSRFVKDHGPALSMISEFMTNWYAETVRWVDATVKIAATESEANAAMLQDWIDTWSAEFRSAIEPYLAAAFGSEAGRLLSTVDDEFQARVRKIGLSSAKELA